MSVGFFVQDNYGAIMSKYTKSYIRSGLYFMSFNTLITRLDFPASTLYSGFQEFPLLFSGPT